MKKFLCLLAIALPMLLSGCSNDETYVSEITPASLVGSTFTDGSFFITIESATTISYFVPTYPNLKGTAKYTFQRGIFKIINPYGRLALEDVTESYISSFEGTFNVRNRLDCDYTVIGPNGSGSVQVFGGGEMWKLEKTK